MSGTNIAGLFKADDDFHNRFFDGNPPPPEQRDNWLVSRREYEDSVSVVDDKKKSIGQKNPTTFFAAPAMSQINYADAIEEDGVFQEKARAAWRTASKLWNDYGNREMRSSRGSLIRLADLNREELLSRKLEKEFQDFAPGVRDEIVAEKRANLSPEVVAALAVPESIRTRGTAMNLLAQARCVHLMCRWRKLRIKLPRSILQRPARRTSSLIKLPRFKIGYS